MRVSIELVPRNVEGLGRELEAILSKLPGTDLVNIPDLMRFELRSWEACAHAKGYVTHAIPHLRAIDIDLKKPLQIAPFLETHKIHEVLVVTGDAPADMSRTVYDSSATDVIRKVREELPGVKVYAALDPYRQSFTKERDYALQKLHAGANGFFTQPFFDLRLMGIYAELLPQIDIFWGVTSVTSERSLSYWKNRNRAVFPKGFEPSLEWSRAFAREALAFVRERDDNIYFMPIRTSAVAYLEGILAPTTATLEETSEVAA